MTPQENSMLQDLIAKVQQTPLTEKDPEAEELLWETLGRDPDAIYKLAQTVVVQNLALNQARAQIQQLQQQAAQPPQQPARASSFLGNLLGRREPAAAQPPPPVAYASNPSQYQPVPPAYSQPPVYELPPQYASYPPPAQPSGAGSFLRSAATTAAGVAAGAMAFEGIESLMHGGHGGSFGSGYGAPPIEETVVNNYYDDDNTLREGGFGERERGEERFAEHHEHEAAYDERPESRDNYKDASYEPDTDPTNFDDSNLPGDDFSSSGGDDLI